MSLPDLGMISRKPGNPALTAYFNFEFPRHSPESFLDWPIAGLASSVSGEPRLSIDHLSYAALKHATALCLVRNEEGHANCMLRTRVSFLTFQKVHSLQASCVDPRLPSAMVHSF